QRPHHLRLHWIFRWQAPWAGTPRLACPARRHGHRRIDSPHCISLGRGRHVPPNLDVSHQRKSKVVKSKVVKSKTSTVKVFDFTTFDFTTFDFSTFRLSTLRLSTLRPYDLTTSCLTAFAAVPYPTSVPSSRRSGSRSDSAPAARRWRSFHQV